MARRSRNKSLLRSSASPPRESSPSSALARLLASPWLPVLLALVTVLVYLPSLRSDFVSDARLEIDEGFVTSLANLPKVVSLHVLGMGLILSDRPGEILYLMLNASLWGRDPLGYHAGSILLHALNVALLLVLLRRCVALDGFALTDRDSLPVQLALATAVLVFALHPIATESVSEISFSSNLLVVLFTLLALLAATAFPPDRLRTALLAGGVGVFCAFAAVFTKESGLALAPLLVVYWFLFRRRETKTPWFVFFGAAFAVSALVFAVILRFAVTRQMHLEYLGGSFAHVFLVQPQLWIFMLGQILCPTNLCADYNLADMSLPSAPLAFVLLLLVLAAQIALATRSRVGALGVATSWLGLATVSNFLPLYCILADRFYYLPLAGVALQLAALFLLLLRSRPAFILAVGFTFATFPVLVSLNLARQAVFSTEAALWSDTLQKSPHSSLAHCNTGLALFHQGRLDDAMAQFQQAIDVDPHSSNASVCLGLIHVYRGRLDLALPRFQAALAMDPANPDAHDYLGLVLLQTGHLDEGIAQIRQALALDPNDVSAHLHLGLALVQQAQLGPALDQFRAALDLDPNSAPAHYELGNALARQGRPDLAVDQFRAVLQLDPAHFAARMNLGVTLMHQGHFDSAIEQFTQALQLRPDSPDAHDNLGVAFIQKGDVAAAVAQFQEALRLDPSSENARLNLEKAQAHAPP